MNKLLIGIVIGLLLGLFGYYCFTLFSPNEIISDDYARVTIENESGRNAKKIVLNAGFWNDLHRARVQRDGNN